MEIGGIISAIVIGLVIGALGRLVVPGKQNVPIWLTIGIGIVAALIGTAIVGPLRDTNGIDWIEILAQVVLAAVGVALASSLRSGRSSRGIR
ncbi:GlsB/YeaQ/YmgE family stress response membrane protein [Kineosporia rhizophila]|uniref:GlsB/YeaQ/YmgE family stress response membrane protein n=1 Tax=Kineosporia rhizophila TaxID=84633 RepID=UPI000B1E80CC|nr:GlsB/YeaQ/YmgE family stress response membrane protein [Kineosporia rhizophila]MCE0534476.1 GlsB/YeaQ/YmgE family stress response membrane protein [Kineosporia rhizophila]